MLIHVILYYYLMMASFSWFMLQIVEALRFCQAQGIVHRDVKDENILVDTRTGDVKMFDFGSGALRKDTDDRDFEGE